MEETKRRRRLGKRLHFGSLPFGFIHTSHVQSLGQNFSAFLLRLYTLGDSAKLHTRFQFAEVNIDDLPPLATKFVEVVLDGLARALFEAAGAWNVG